jgi:hypothetical protein
MTIMRFPRLGLLGFSALLPVLISCSQVQQATSAVKDLIQVQRELAKKLGSNDIGVNLTNGGFLTIRLVNSPLNELPEVERNAKALEIAQVAYNNYPSHSALQSVSVNFGIHRKYLIVSYEGSAGVYRFAASQLEAAQPAPSVNP